jgi:hypothetical protein
VGPRVDTFVGRVLVRPICWSRRGNTGWVIGRAEWGTVVGLSIGLVGVLVYGSLVT